VPKIFVNGHKKRGHMFFGTQCITASLVVVRDVWPISIGHKQCWSMTS